MTPERLKELTDIVSNVNYWVRKKAAEALDLPLELQEILARDEYGDVRYWLAMNTSVVNVELQEILARDENWAVRCGLARNTSLVNVELQELLVRNNDWAVRYYLAKNPSFTDRKLWEILRNDEVVDVKRAINKKINEEKDKIKAEFKNKISAKA